MNSVFLDVKVCAFVCVCVKRGYRYGIDDVVRYIRMRHYFNDIFAVIVSIGVLSEASRTSIWNVNPSP